MSRDVHVGPRLGGVQPDKQPLVAGRAGVTCVSDSSCIDGASLTASYL